MGNLRDLEPDDMPDSEYGLYILPQPIHYTSGRLISVTTNGFYNPSEQSNSIIFVLFRQMLNGSYCEALRIISDPINNSGDVHRTITIHINKTVTACDLIGLQNTNCRREGNVCFQPAIQSNITNDTVLYGSTSKFSDQMGRNGVYLNMQASIQGKGEGGSLFTMLSMFQEI